MNGREQRKVEEPLWGKESVVIAEFEAYPEPKTLTAHDLTALKAHLGTCKAVAQHTGTSHTYVKENLNKTRGD